MADLEALQRQFMSVQNTRAKRKIPERMVMEIVQLAASTHPLFSNNPLLHSLNGRDFLTKSRLIQEIKEEIKISKGRARIDELPTQLQIGAEHVQSCLSELKQDSFFHFVGGHQIVTEDYIQRYLWPEINSQIETKGGYTLLTQIANALDLPLAFIKRILKREDLSDEKRCLTLSNNLLYSQEFVKNLKLTLKAFVQAVLRPVTLSQLLERFRKYILSKSNEQIYLQESFYRDLITELIQSGEIKGFVSQGVYTSKAFIQLQRRMVKELFSKKRIIEYSFLKNECKISKPRDFIKDNLEGGVFLAHAYVHQTVIDETYALIREVCTTKQETKSSEESKRAKKSVGGGCINLQNTLSVSLGAEDVDEIMEKFPNRGRLTIIETFVMN